ncbi:MAG: hypothetical protein JWR38_4440 [Mucilaginibacter sp.]|nr:hypothetical protein [Mucilaginibacter sp.]
MMRALGYDLSAVETIQTNTKSIDLYTSKQFSFLGFLCKFYANKKPNSPELG